MALRIVTLPAEMQAIAEEARRAGKRIGVVPTMGYLHKGHTSLMDRIRPRCDLLITTLFVNPAQFGKGEDFERYPRDLGRDQRLAAEHGTDILFAPSADSMYPQEFDLSVVPGRAATILEGAFRPGHFAGVATVVAKLFNITKPHCAVFGQKDAQQAYIIQAMVRDLNFDVEIDIAPIVREEDGLAMSSRNVYLSPDERKRALALFRSLTAAGDMIAQGERSVAEIEKSMRVLLNDARPTQIDYVAFVDPRTFTETASLSVPDVLVALAVRFGSTRLIDNMVFHITQ